MDINLQHTPFSRRGAYYTISRVVNQEGLTAGLYLRTIHGDAVTREIFHLSVVKEGTPVEYIETVHPERLCLKSESGFVEICFYQPERFLIRGTGVGLRITAVLAGNYDLIAQRGANEWQYFCYGANVNLLLTALDGQVDITAPWDGLKNTGMAFTISPSEGGHSFMLQIMEFLSTVPPVSQVDSFDSCIAEVRKDFDQWLGHTLKVPDQFTAVHTIAAYLNWATLVLSRGRVCRPSILMSKNWMIRVWSWDHCLNAMALTHNIPLACHQVLSMFDHQDHYGCLPDSFNDTEITLNFAKPPIHGWTVGWLMERVQLPNEFLERVYHCLIRWTDWWTKHRDFCRDGFPVYNHGNDSGWDNSTVFGKGVPVQSPDLYAFLVIQMEVIARLAGRFGDTKAQESWQNQSDKLLSDMLSAFWKDDHFVARLPMTNETIECKSLIMYMPLVLGERLPKDVFEKFVERLQKDHFLTEYGLATEATDSPFYEPDGYWRGPIWAPSTMIVVDGLKRGGLDSLSQIIAQRYCKMVLKGGMSENFNALTGQGQRDRAYTWTSSIFLIFANSYI